MSVLADSVDTRPISAPEVIPLLPDATATPLYSKVEAAHITLIRRTWPSFEAETVAPQPQDETQATVWPGRRPEDGAIHPGLTTADIDRLVRALTPPYPGVSSGTRLSFAAQWTAAEESEYAVGASLSPGYGALEIWEQEAGNKTARNLEHL